MKEYTSHEQILRIAINGGLWVFMDNEHHKYIKEHLIDRDDFYMDEIDPKDPQKVFDTVIEKADELGLDYGTNEEDPIDTIIIENDEDSIDEAINFLMIEIPSEEEDDE